MSHPLPRFFNEMGMRVVRLTATEKAAAEARFNQLVVEADAKGLFDGPLGFQLHNSLYMRAHYGADASTVMLDGVELEPLPAMAMQD